MVWFNSKKKKLEQEQAKAARIAKLRRQWDEDAELRLSENKKRARQRENALDYDKAIELYERIGDVANAKRLRMLKNEQRAVKVSQKVVHGDEVTKTEIKDSVLNRSNVGSSGDDKFTKLKELTEMKKEGLISVDEYEKMKREIIG